MQIKRYLRGRLPPWWPMQQEGKFPIGLGMLTEIVVDDQGILSPAHPGLGNSTTGKGCQIAAT